MPAHHPPTRARTGDFDLRGNSKRKSDQGVLLDLEKKALSRASFPRLTGVLDRARGAYSDVAASIAGQATESAPAAPD